MMVAAIKAVDRFVRTCPNMVAITASVTDLNDWRERMGIAMRVAIRAVQFKRGTKKYERSEAKRTGWEEERVDGADEDTQ